MKIILICLSVILLTPPDSRAGEVSQSHVEYEGGHYQVKLVMRINARVEKVYAVLTDFNQLTALNDAIKISKLLSSSGKTHLVRIEVEGCVWVFCKRVRQEQRISEMGNGYIQGVTLPDKSDMAYGRVLWHIAQSGKLTVISYHADVVPAFFIPPLIGPYIMKGRLLEEGEKTIRGIERIIHTNDNKTEL